MPVIGRFALGLVLGILSVATAPLASAQVFRQTLDVGLEDPDGPAGVIADKC